MAPLPTYECSSTADHLSVSTDELDFWSDPLACWLGACLRPPQLLHPVADPPLPIDHLITPLDALSQQVQAVSTMPEELACTPRPQFRCVGYKQLCDGQLLNALLLYIDSRAVYCDVRSAADVPGRLRNMALLFNNIQHFYRDVLKQLIVMPLPDLLSIARHPSPESSGPEMKKVLLLLLGCAVQSDKKEEFVNRIKQLELSLQEAIVEQIQKITNNAECVLNVQALELDPDDQSTSTVLHQLQKVVKERDTYAQQVLELHQEQECDSASGSSSVCNGDVCARKLPEAQQHAARCTSPATTSSAATADRANNNNHSNVELAATKAQLRKLRDELDEKSIVLSELRDDYRDKDSQLQQLQTEKIELLREARAAKDYRDELDCMQHKVHKLERLESETKKQKEKLQELDFFRSRVEELRQENYILVDTKQVLETQLDSWKQRALEHGETESTLIECQRQLHNLQNELRQERDKYEELYAESRRAQRELNSMCERASQAEHELQAINAQDDGASQPGGRSLADQLGESERQRVLQLELDNQKLRNQLDEMSVSTCSRSELLAVQSELNDRQTANQRLVNDKNSLEMKLSQIQEEMDSLRSSVSREKESLQREFEQSTHAMTTSQTENMRMITSDYQLKCDELQHELAASSRANEQLTTDNQRLTDQIAQLQASVSETQTKLIDLEETRLQVEARANDRDRENRCLEKEKHALKAKLTDCDAEIEGLRSRLVEHDRDVARLADVDAKLSTARQQLAEADTERRQLETQLAVETEKAHRRTDELVTEKTKSADLLSNVDCIFRSLDMERAEDESFETQIIQRFNTKCRQLDNAKTDCKMASMKVSELTMQLAVAKQDIERLNEQLRQHSQQERSHSNLHHDELKLLKEENRSLKEQIGLLQEKARRHVSDMEEREAQLQTMTAEADACKRDKAASSATSGELARLQVALSNSELQEKLLKKDNSELQQQCGQLEKVVAETRADYEKYQTLHAELLADHEHLQSLHDQLNLDYERLKKELADTKLKVNSAKSLDSQVSELHKQCDKDKKAMGELKAMFVKEQAARQIDLRTHALLQNEHGDLKRQYDEMRSHNETLAGDMHRLQADCRQLRSDQQASELRSRQAQGQLNELQDALGKKDLEIVKIGHKCDMLHQLNKTLENESRTLLHQMDSLIAQNQELLTQALRDKDSYHHEERDMQDKLNALKRHKEKLEEKIIEQYRLMENADRKSPRESKGFIRKARALLPGSNSKQSTPTRQHRQTTASSPEDDSLGDDPSTAANGHVNTMEPEPRPQSTNGYANGVNGHTDEHQYTGPSTVQPTRQSSARRSVSNGSSKKPRPVSGCPQSNDNRPSSTQQQQQQPRRSAESRISWTGSERAVDVPVAGGSHSPHDQQQQQQPPSLPPMRNGGLGLQRSYQGGSASQHNGQPPKLPPPRGSMRGPPPPYPGTRATVVTTRPASPPTQQANSNRLPPPYPGATGLRPNAQRPISTCDEDDQLQLRVGSLPSPGSAIGDLAGHNQDSQAHSHFAPPISSTPKQLIRVNGQQQEHAYEGSPLQLRRALAQGTHNQLSHSRKSTYDNLTTSTYHQEETMIMDTEQTTTLVTDETLDVTEESLLADDSLLTNDGANPTPGEKSNVWYEYGCV